MIATEATATRFGSFRPQKHRHFLLQVLQLFQKSPAFVTIACRSIFGSAGSLIVALDGFDSSAGLFLIEPLGEPGLLSLGGARGRSKLVSKVASWVQFDMLVRLIRCH